MTKPSDSTPLHPFGELLTQYRRRKAGLTQTHLAELAGYDQAILVRMCRGKKDLTGPSGRERVVRLIETLAEQGALTLLEEANALLLAADMPPLFERQASELKLMTRLTKSPLGHRTRRTNLPAALTSFIGRAQEVAEVRRLLNTTRLLTLTGSGGCGKTRMAQRVAADVLIGYPDGVWYTEFALITDPALSFDMVAHSLGLVPTEQSTHEQVLDYLRERQVLLVFDNCEHLIEAIAIHSVELLRACPRVTILTTSREALNVEGEITWRVPPMQPDEASHLFVERATASQFDLDSHTQEHTVATICQRLDGMPLAIELAAARLSILSLDEIALRLNDRLSLLTHGRRSALPRHQTLRAMIDWSYDTLSDLEKIAFSRLSVFVGGWTFDDAKHIVSDALIDASDLINLHAQLVSKSLVSLTVRQGETRYFYLETIREYAIEKLKQSGETTTIHNKHVQLLTSLAIKAEPHIHDNEQQKWLMKLEDELANLREALAWSLSPTGDPLLGLKLASHLWLFWWVGHVVEGTVWLKRLIEASHTLAPLFDLGRAYLGYGTLILATAEPVVIKEAIDTAIELLNQVEDREGTTFALYILGCCKDYWEDERVQALLKEGWSLERWTGNRLCLEYATYMCMRHHILHPRYIAENFSNFQSVVKFAEARRDLQTVALASFDLSRSALANKNLELALDIAKQALASAKTVGACWEQCATLNLLGEIWRVKGNLAQAEQCAIERSELLMRYGWPEAFRIHNLTLRGRISRDQGQLVLARAFFRQACQIPNNWFNPSILDGLGCVASAMNDYQRSARLLGAADKHRDEVDMPRYSHEIEDVTPYIAKARQQLGETAYHAAHAEGYAMPLDQAIAYALSDG